jgi:dCMP deaminase
MDSEPKRLNMTRKYFFPMTIRNKVDYYINISRNVAKRSTCVRRKFGAVIVKNDSILGTGYNGSARGAYNCGVDIPCLKNLYDEPHETSYVKCSAIHAEDNAISAVGWERCNGATMFLAPHEGKGYLPCYQCRRKIITANIKDLYYIDEYEELRHITHQELVQMERDWQMDVLLAKNPDWEIDML